MSFSLQGTLHSGGSHAAFQMPLHSVPAACTHACLHSDRSQSPGALSSYGCSGSSCGSGISSGSGCSNNGSSSRSNSGGSGASARGGMHDQSSLVDAGPPIKLDRHAVLFAALHTQGARRGFTRHGPGPPGRKVLGPCFGRARSGVHFRDERRL